MNASLYLFPLPVLDQPPAVDKVIAALQGCGFMGDSLDEQRYLTGPAFFSHITFAGCSPYLQLQKPDDGGWGFCHIRLHEDRFPPLLHVTPQRGRPRCPVCRGSIPGWKERLSRWGEVSPRLWQCEQCAALTPLAELDWRQYGVAARCSVEIHQVYPGEALPGEGLLQLLQEQTGREWGYAWADSLV